MAKKKENSSTKIRKKPLGLRIWNHRGFYLMFLPVFIFVIIMYYWPMLGIRYALYHSENRVGGGTEWFFAGLSQFFGGTISVKGKEVVLKGMFMNPDFWRAFKNTLIISIVKLLLNTFVAVVISIFLNEMRSLFCKKIVQTVIYLPHFMSYAVVSAIFLLFLSPSSTGMINNILKSWHWIEEPIDFLGSTKWWPPVFYFINLWKETGWGTVIFFATLSGISPELYEAAEIDGATRLQKMRYVTLPALANTIIIVLILNIAKVLNIFEPVFVLYNNSVYDVADVISTYVFRMSFDSNIQDWGYSTAVGLFKSIVGMLLMLASNYASKKVRGRGII